MKNKNKIGDEMNQKLHTMAADIPVVILCGGAGISLEAHRSLVPKAMVDIDGAPLLQYILTHYTRFGFKRFILCSGSGGMLIKEYVSHLSFLDHRLIYNVNKGRVEIRCVPETPQATQRAEWHIEVVDTGIENMTGSRLSQMRMLLEGSQTFCLTYGDTISDIDLHELFAFHQQHGKTGTLLAVHNPTRFRILGLRDGDFAVRGFSEKPILDKDYINGGFYIFNKSIFNVKTLTQDSSCVLENEVLDELIAGNNLCAFRHKGFWQPLDNARDRKTISTYLKKMSDK